MRRKKNKDVQRIRKENNEIFMPFNLQAIKRETKPYRISLFVTLSIGIMSETYIYAFSAFLSPQCSLLVISDIYYTS